MGSRNAVAGRNPRAGRILRPDLEEGCHCQPWKAVVRPVPKSGSGKLQVVQNSGSVSTSTLLRLGEAIEQEFRRVDSDPTPKATGSELKNEKPGGKSQSSITSNGGGPQKNGMGGRATQNSRQPSKNLPDKRLHSNKAAGECSGGKVDKQTRPGRRSDSDSSGFFADQERAISTQDSHLKQGCHVSEEPAGALGWKERYHEYTEAAVREEGNLKLSKEKRMARRNDVFSREDGVKLLEYEPHDRPVLPIACAAEPSTDPLRRHKHKKELIRLQLEALMSRHGTGTQEPGHRKLKTLAMESALPSCSATVGQESTRDHGLLLQRSSLLRKESFQDHEVLLAQQKVRELRLDPACSTSSEFASGPQVDSSQGVSAPRSRDCASEEDQEFDTELAEKQLEALLIPRSQALDKEPFRLQMEKLAVHLPTPHQTVPREGSPIYTPVQNSEVLPISTDVAKQPYHVGRKGYIAEPNMFYDAIESSKLALHEFYIGLITHYKTQDAMMVGTSEPELPDWPEKTKGTKLRAILSGLSRSGVAIAGPDDKLFYSVEAHLNTIVFLDFDREDFGLGDGAEGFSNPGSRQIACMEEFNDLDPSSPSLKRFQRRRFELMSEQIGFSKMSWPLSVFKYAMGLVWKAHKLAFAFEPPVTMFQLHDCLQFNPLFMEPHTQTMQKPLLPDASWPLWTAEFMVTPGFHVQDRLVVKSQVYCIPAEN